MSGIQSAVSCDNKYSKLWTGIQQAAGRIQQSAVSCDNKYSKLWTGIQQATSRDSTNSRLPEDTVKSRLLSAEGQSLFYMFFNSFEKIMRLEWFKNIVINVQLIQPVVIF